MRSGGGGRLLAALFFLTDISAAAGFVAGLGRGSFSPRPGVGKRSGQRQRLTAMADRFYCGGDGQHGEGSMEHGFERLGYASVPSGHKIAAGPDLQV